MAVLLNDWTGCTVQDVFDAFAERRPDSYSLRGFSIPLDTAGVEILLASYGSAGGYDGDAFVLFRKDGRLYEVNGSHCSCFGLEGQWHPEETTKEALLHRLGNGRLGKCGDHEFSFELGELLHSL